MMGKKISFVSEKVCVRTFPGSSAGAAGCSPVYLLRTVRPGQDWIGDLWGEATVGSAGSAAIACHFLWVSVKYTVPTLWYYTVGGAAGQIRHNTEVLAIISFHVSVFKTKCANAGYPHPVLVWVMAGCLAKFQLKEYTLLRARCLRNTHWG